MSKTPENTLTFTENNFFYRVFGIFLFSAGLLLVVLAWKIQSFFALPEIFSKIIVALTFGIIGIVLIFFGYVMIDLADKKIIFDRQKKMVFYSEKKFFKETSKTFSFAQFIRLTQDESNLENYNLYENFIVFQENEVIKLPSDYNTDKTYQNSQLKQIAEYLNIK